jgi:hypothetical protein
VASLARPGGNVTGAPNDLALPVGCLDPCGVSGCSVSCVQEGDLGVSSPAPQRAWSRCMEGFGEHASIKYQDDAHDFTIALRVRKPRGPNNGVARIKSLEHRTRYHALPGWGSLLCSAENPERSANGQARASSVIGRVPTLPQNAPVPAWQKSEQPLESLDKHSACHAEGRGFEPRRSRQSLQAFSSPSHVALQLLAGLRFNFLTDPNVEICMEQVMP